jgi:hypothetical protein
MWVSADWEQCTSTCGSRGMQEREVFCVHNHTDSNEPPWKHMVDPERCRVGVKPETLRPCNRVPCPAHWISGNWSQVWDEQALNLYPFCERHIKASGRTYDSLHGATSHILQKLKVHYCVNWPITEALYHISSRPTYYALIYHMPKHPKLSPFMYLTRISHAFLDSSMAAPCPIISSSLIWAPWWC